MISSFFQWFKPQPAAPRRSDEDVARLYPMYRWRVFQSAFIAYATFYVVRNNFAPVAKDVGEAMGYNYSQIGNILAGTAIAYGIGKFIMGYFADRCDARKYVFVAMLLTALCNFAFASASNYPMHQFLWMLNGFVQGMGYGPNVRALSHWYSFRERGTVFNTWLVSHNIGGGLAGVIAAQSAKYFGWSSAFYVPGAIAIVCAFYLLWRMIDTPREVGLPPVEEYKQDYPQGAKGNDHDREIPASELFMKYILPNKWLWLLCLANVFIYIARYSMLDWGPTYLREVKGASITMGGFSTMAIEFSGVLGMLLMGWISDKVGGKRWRVTFFCMLPLPFVFYAIRLTPEGMLWLDMTLFGLIGFLIYAPVAFSGVMSLDFTSKKAVGTATGLVGLFGYLGRVIQAKGIGYIAENYGWDAVIFTIEICTVIGIVTVLLMWNAKARG
jgi:OPA family glycerol-3-phosphate transporter-like MFS transporter